MKYNKTALKEHFNILDYISKYVNLKKTGRNYVGLCPFHQEKTPSFAVNEERQIFHCFGCGVGGDLILFLEKYLKLNFYDVLLMLEKDKGIKLIERDKEIEKKNQLRDKLLTINKKALTFFVNNLFKTTDGGEALKYLRNRKLSLGTIKKFYLGFGGREWDRLARELEKLGFSSNDIEKTGLVVSGQVGKRDFFKNRIIIPILNQKNEVIGFGGRALDNSLPKYVNSAESPVFSKRKNIFGINIAKEHIIKTKTVFIVEGYLDCLMMHQAGYNNTVATLGTAITEEQIKLLKGITEKIYLLYDGDEAGNKASLRAVEIFLNLGISPYIVRLPEGEDPDSLIAKGEKSTLDAKIEGAENGIDFLINSYKIKYSLKTSEGIRSFLYALNMHVQNIKNPLEIELIAIEASKVSGVSASDILGFSLPSKENTNKQKQEVVCSSFSSDDYIVAFLLCNPQFNDYIDDNIKSLLSPEHKEIIDKVVIEDKEDELTEAAKGLYSMLVVSDWQIDLNKDAFLDNINFLKKKKIKMKKDEIQKLIESEENLPNPDHQKIFKLQGEKEKLVLMEKEFSKRS